MSKIIINCPVNGKVVPTTKVKDETFSQNMMGEGFAVIPSDGKFVAPVAGEVILADGHAIAIRTADKLEILIHIGLDTVELEKDDKQKNEVFAHTHKVGDKVKAGEVIVTVDLKAIKKAKKDTITPVIVLADSLNGKSVSMDNMGEVDAGEAILSVE